MATNTREIALDTLLTLEKEGGMSSALIADVLKKYDYLDQRDKAFIKRVCEGTIERKIELDYYIDGFSSLQVRKMKPFIRVLMRMSAYQLLFMDGVPASAVVNEACKLADKRKFHNLKGFVNAVLRKISVEKDKMKLPDRAKDLVRYLSVKCSLPEELVAFFLKNYSGEETERMLSYMDEIHPVSIRFKSTLSKDEIEALVSKMEKSGAKLKKSPYLDYVYTATHVGGVHNLSGYEDGKFIIQDVSSALAVESAGISKNDFVMDLCAAPGGKSILAAEKAKEVASFDLYQGKVNTINENIARMKAENITASVQDATVFNREYSGKADLVICDVPCSGLGVMGKKRDIKYNVTPESMAELIPLQKKIVENGAGYLKKTGRLLYSTCTLNPAENRDMVKWITKNLPLKPVDMSERIPDSLKGKVGDTTDGVLLRPGFVESDGFFYCLFERK
ncbi:MAG: 16S rRNA (cytosine(967)-C(5))-methyltransferase RsmB [Lachnospiraceae bacterium]|nr:16S rRNA (cytosine(967)-C(5))-methyltransferase RsmB [Lachnospiraceae bacterium]